MKLNQRGVVVSFSEGLALKAVSLLLALILWITILGFKREEQRLDIHLEPLLPPGMVITNNIPSSIQFTVSGPRVLLRDLHSRVGPIRPDLRRTRETTIGFSITEDLIGKLPNGVKVIAFSPPNILIRLEELVERSIRVKPVLMGTPAPGYQIRKVILTPDRVTVIGPKSYLDVLDFVNTEPFSIEALDGVRDGVASIEIDQADGFSLGKDRVVRIRVLSERK